MTKKATKKDTARVMTWKEAYSFCAAHVLVDKKRATRPELHHVAIRLAAGNPSMVILAATSGQTAAFLEMGIGWLASVLPALPAQLEERWQYVDKDGALFFLPHGGTFPSGIRNVIPQDLEHRPGYGPHLGYWVFEPIFRSMKAAGFVGGEWYMAPQRHRVVPLLQAHIRPFPDSFRPWLFMLTVETMARFSATFIGGLEPPVVWISEPHVDLRDPSLGITWAKYWAYHTKTMEPLGVILGVAAPGILKALKK